MKNLMSLFLVFSFAVALVGCGGGDVSSQPDNSSSSSQASTASQSTTQSASQPATQPQNPYPDYSAYSSIIYAYTVAQGSFESETFIQASEGNPEYFATYGNTYIDLIDFDGNGVLELVFATFEEEYTNEYSLLDYDNSFIHIYTITPEEGLTSVWEMNPTYFAINYDAYGIDYVKDGDKTYFAIGDDWAPDGITYYEFIDNSFVPKTNFSSIFDYTTYDTSFYVDGISVTIDEFERAKKDFLTETELVLITGIEQENLDALIATNNEALDYLSDYPRGNYYTENMYFEDGMFAALEDTPENAQEQVVADYYMAYAKKDFDALANIIPSDNIDSSMNLSIIEDNFDRGYFIPGHIISNFSVLKPEEYAIESVHLAEMVLPFVEDKGLTNHYLVRHMVNEALDREVTPPWGQVTGGLYRNWALVASKDNGATWKIYEIFNDKFFWHDPMLDDAFSVGFLGYDSEVSALERIPGTDLPISITYYLNESKYDYNSIQLTAYEGDEHYLVRSGFGGEIYVYENSVDAQGNNVRGELIHKTELGEILYLRCNVSDIYNNVELVIISPEGYEYSYYPGANIDSYPIQSDYAGPLFYEH